MQAEQQSERERFEAWATHLDSAPPCFDKDRDGYYEDWDLQRVWRGWQARAALSHPSPQGWQDISTAPQDRIILIAVHHLGDDWRTFVAQADRSGDGTTWWSTTAPLGWTKLHGGWTPSFWMPLPHPPEQGSKG